MIYFYISHKHTFPKIPFKHQNFRFTVTKCRGWQLVRQAIDDKRVHQLSLFEDYLLQQQLQKEQQQANKKSAIKELAQKMKISQVPDLHGEERELWEAKQLIDILDLNLLKMDSAPFRLIAETSLLNCYSLFSLLCLNRAYVTNFGKLVGVITLSEVSFNFHHNFKLCLFRSSKLWMIFRKAICSRYLKGQ